MIYIDFDGVLFDTLEMSWRATAEVLFNSGISDGENCLQALPLDFYLSNFWGRSWLSGLQTVGEYYHGGGFSLPADANKIQGMKDAMVIKTLQNLDDPVNTGALVMLVFSRVPIIYCTSEQVLTASVKTNIVDETLKNIGVEHSTTLICNVDKTNPDFWRNKDATIVIDDDIRVIQAAEKVGLRTIHWREFLPKGN